MREVEFSSESAFWHLLARRVERESARSLPNLFAELNARAVALRLPVAYSGPHANAWAVLCRLFALTHGGDGALDRKGLAAMKEGFSRVLGPAPFAAAGLERIRKNIEAPAVLGRSMEESVVDTFLIKAAATTLVEGRHVPAGDPSVVTECLHDPVIFALAGEVCRPREAAWDEAVVEYARRRPGWFKRRFSDPRHWLFD